MYSASSNKSMHNYVLWNYHENDSQNENESKMHFYSVECTSIECIRDHQDGTTSNGELNLQTVMQYIAWWFKL